MPRKISSKLRWLPRWLVGIYGAAALVLVPWIGFMALALPQRHLSRHWDVTWIGFDTALLCALALTAVLGHRRSGWIVVAATSLATLLLADVWFDVSTARPGPQLELALLMALLIELPLALASLIISGKTIATLLEE